MGSICRHEVPMRFFNLLHGECYCDIYEIYVAIHDIIICTGLAMQCL